jgi:glycine/D-amino acid oxidase-like deaminating enzyme
MAKPFPLEPSLWHATAAPAVATPALAESVRTDVCVIGGGFAGLSTALHLAERGTSVVVLEAQEPGFGGSGRNGGQVIPGLKYDPDELDSMFGQERGAKLAAFAGGTADVVFGLIDKHKMNVPHVRAGWIQSAHTPESVETVRKRAAQWAARGADTVFLDKVETERHLGTRQYLGAWIDKRGGGVQPLSYARGLARAAQAAGARIYGHSPVTSLAREGAFWAATTKQGARVTASRVVICTNGYTGNLWPKLRQTVIAPNSFIVATEPLSDNVRKSILPFGQVSSDTRQLLLYFRLDHTGRLLMGGRGMLGEPRGPGNWGHIERVAAKLFPQIAGAKLAFRWGGRVAITRDFLPHLHEPAPGVLIDIGCMGRGVGLQSAMGQAMAAYVHSGNPDALPLPLTPIKPLPFHGLHKAYVAAIIAWYRMTDGGVKA